MAHLTNPAARNLSLTEELERLEQTITLTLQEIDHNFSRAHRIVTTSILPVVEQYGEHSKNVWESSKFWKQFFEASANVSLSGYEDLAGDQDDASVALSHDDASTYADSTMRLDDTTTSMSGIVSRPHDDDNNSLYDENMETPHVSRSFADPTTKRFADHESPYANLKREYQDGPDDDEDSTELIMPSTPNTIKRIPKMHATPGSAETSTTYDLPSTTKRRVDPLLHRVLDKNYRVQATPHSGHKSQIPVSNLWQDAGSPMSSPIAAPQLRSEIFNSPKRVAREQINAPRTPGVSVQTPMKRVPDDFTAKYKEEISWESDEDDDADNLYQGLGMSPPKTIQFAFPQSRLLQTPAHEASKRIVDDLLRTAGGGADDTDDIEIDLTLDSPAFIKSRNDLLDDEF